jgi:hypothetical protein
MCRLEPYRNGTARLKTFIAGIARRRQTRRRQTCCSQTTSPIPSAVIPLGTPGIRGIPDGYFPGIPNGYRWVFQGIHGYFAKRELRLAQISQCEISELERRPFRREPPAFSTWVVSLPRPAFGAPPRRSRSDPKAGSGSIPTGSRRDPERTPDKFGIKSGSRSVTPLEFGIKENSAL